MEINKYHLSADKAEKVTISTLEKLGAKSPKNGWPNSILAIKTEKEQVRKYYFKDLVEEARFHGFVPVLQKLIDRNDEMFGGAFGVATDSRAIKYNCSFAGFSKELAGPFRIYPIEEELSNDILYFRKEACHNSNISNFELTCRYYRSYLFSCISLIEAYINRHILLFEFKNIDNPIIADLIDSTSNIEVRLELLFQITTGKRIDEIKGTIEWDHFKKIKKARNELIHSSEPYYGNQINLIANGLNLVKKGIGGLLLIFRKHQNIEPLAFMYNLASAPEIRYRSI